MSAALILSLLLQSGPLVSPGAAPPIQLPPPLDRPANIKRHRAESIEADGAPTTAPQSRLQACLTQANRDPLAGIELAEKWRAVVKGTPAVEPNWCLALAQTRLEHWPQAEQAFIAARDAAGANPALRARLGGAAGNAVLAQGDAARALALLDEAHGEAIAAADTALAGGIALDRGRALVALGRESDAATALAEARAANPRDPLAWLLSATLARRQHRLDEAQSQIEQAVQLAPGDPEIGLEAGLISVLAGRDEAARKSWQSVIALAPDSPAAQTARGYLAQLASPTEPIRPKP